MDPDLRDAYAALKLLRADLMKTRREKQSLEASLAHVQKYGPLPSAAQIRETRELQHMQDEDVNSQLWRLAIQYEMQLAEMTKINIDTYGPPVTKRTDNEHQDGHPVETLAMLHKLQRVTATMEQQTETMLTQEATFLLQKGELESMLEETQHMLETEKKKGADAVLEQQTIQEKYEFLATQVESLKAKKLQLEKEKTARKVAAAHVQTRSLLSQQLKEREEECVQWKSHETLQCDQKTHGWRKDVSGRLFERENEVKEKTMDDTHQREMLVLQGENELLRFELNQEKEKRLQDENDMRAQHVRALGELERNCAELKARVADSELERIAEAKMHEEVSKEAEGQHAATMKILELKLVEAHKEFAASEANRSIETQEYEKTLGEALKKIQDQREGRDQHVVTLRNLHSDLEAAQTQLEMAEAKLVEEAKNHQEQLKGVLQQLHDQEHDKERNAMTLCDLESLLSEAYLQLGDSETNHIAQLNEYEDKLLKTSQVATQHENAARMLSSEKKALQQEVCEARHTLKLMTEKLLTCQLVCEERTQEHMRRMCHAQKQCESLETQLLLGEDHREVSCVTKSVHDPFTLAAFYSRADDDITAMSPWRFWALLGSGIKEIDDFLPQFQTVLGATSDALKLCESHTDALPVLCERLQRKGTSEKEEIPVLSTALRLLRFVEMLRAQTQQDEMTVTVDLVHSFRKRVLEALAQWYECDAGDNDNDQGKKKPMPTPTFTTTSRETALILQNWTNDRTKQLGVRRWLARMEAYPGVPPLRGASSNRVLELPPEGCTLELHDMTLEVKDAFLLLVIPILKQNRALHVRVFIRYACNYEATLTQQRGDEEGGSEKVWSMRIHVQSTVTRSRPASLKLSPSSRGSPSPLAPASPASSVSSSTSSTASSRLQIIQERLQYLHHNV